MKNTDSGAACLPMLRPIYLILLRRPLPGNPSQSASISYGQYIPPLRPVSEVPTAYKTETPVTHIELIDKAESDSIHELTRRGSSLTSSTSDFERSGHGNTTVVRVGSSGDRFDEQPRTRSMGLVVGKGGERRVKGSARSSVSNAAGETGWNNLGGIMVTNEMSVTSDRAH
jgi:hypothetical protein